MISSDDCTISYENCAIIKKKTSRVGGIFRVGRVTQKQLSYGVCVAVTGSTWQNVELFKNFPLSSSTHQSNPVIATCIYRICNYHATATSHYSSQKLPYMAPTDGSWTTPHWGQFLKPNDFSSGPWSLGQLTRTIPHQDHHQPVKPFVRTNICPVGNCPGGELSGYAYRWLYVNMAPLHKFAFERKSDKSNANWF